MKKIFFLNREAYEVACLGVTHKDWDLLGRTALETSQFEIARKSFIHTRDYKYLSLITQLQVKSKH